MDVFPSNAIMLRTTQNLVVSFNCYHADVHDKKELLPYFAETK